MPNRIRLLAALGLAASAACGPKRQGATEPATVVFVNESADLAEVYAVSSAGATIRVGTVEAGRTASLRIPGTALGGDGTVRISARIFARPRVAPSTGPFPLREGERVEVRLPADLRMLSVLPAKEP
jgi:hypothetical protein